MHQISASVKTGHIVHRPVGRYAKGIMVKQIYWRYYKTRANVWRRRRLLFPSPAELRLIVLMGGRVVQLKWLRDPRTKFPLAFVLNRGRLFKAEQVRREVRVGPYYVDFGNDIGRAIEVDGREYHTDVVAAFDRDSYLYQRNWQVMHIPAHWLWLQQDKVQREVLWFLTK